jgi:hypothetical protein
MARRRWPADDLQRGISAHAQGSEQYANQRHPEAAIGTQLRAASRGQLIQPSGAVTRTAHETSLLAAV